MLFRSILCYQQAGEIDNLTITLGQSFLVVLCAGVCPSPTGSITLVSSLRENLLLHSSYLPLGVSQRTCDLHVSSIFSSVVARDLEAHLLRDFNSCNNTFSATIEHFFWRHIHQAAARGVSNFQPFYFVIVLLSLFLLCVVCFLYQKSKKISYLFFILSF